MKIRSLAVAVLCTSLLFGCSSNKGDSAGGRQRFSVEKNIIPYVYDSLDISNTSDSSNREIAQHSFYQNSLKECLDKKGWAYWKRPASSDIDISMQTDFKSIQYAHRYGFGALSAPHFTEFKQNKEFRNTLSSGKQTRYDSDMSFCESEAEKAKDTFYHVDQVSTVSRNVDAEIRRSKEYIEAQRKWVKCASSRGVEAKSREDLVQSFLDKRDDPQLKYFQNKEKQVAIAVFPCSKDLDSAYKQQAETLIVER